MDQNQVENVEQQLYQDRGTSFRGTARIRFAHLHFGSQCPREPNKKITAHLKEKFSTEGCHRLEPKNHIPAVINQKTLDASIRTSPKVSQDSLLENGEKQPPELKFPDNFTIECLQGLHRIAAGKEYLPRRDWWWTIDLYLEDASRDLRIALSEEYTNSVNFSDGEIFLKLRQYDSKINRPIGTLFAEKRMWGRLSRDKRKDLKQIQGHKVILAGFDALRILPALFAGFRIEHRFMPMKCHEEAANYLRHILEVWHKIFEDKKTLMRLVRSQDVELLQLRAPGYSSHDSSVISKHFREGTIFPGIKKKDDRKRIWENLQSIECLIPSLFSFFADVKYLQAPAKILRQLCPPSRYSIREAMWRSFTGHGLPDNQWLLQTWEGDAHCRWIQGSSSNQFEFGYQHIWLYALRHWVEMVPECPKKEDGEETPIPYRPDPRRWYEIAKLAAKRGFESDQIDRLLSSDPDREVARQALFKARNPEYFKYDESAFDSYVAELSRIFKSAEEIPPDNLKPCFLTPGCGESLERRCGRVFNNAYKADRKYLFLEQLYQPIHGEASGVSSFAVRVSVYFAFFRRDYSTDTHIKSVKDRAHPPPSHADENGGNGTRPIIESQSGTQGQGLPVNALAIAPGTSGMQAMPSTSGTNYDCTKPGALMTSVSPGEPSTTNNPNADADDAVMADYIAEDPSRIILKVWGDGKLKDYPESLPIDQDKVEKCMLSLASNGFNLLNIHGRAMRPIQVFTEVVRNKSQIVVITKENGIKRQMVAAIKQSLHLEKRSRQARHQV